MAIRSLGIACAVLGASLAAQSPLTTTYAGGNGFGTNAMIWFDLTVNTAVAISQIDINAGAGSTAGSIDVYTIAGGHAGFETNSAAWTMQGSVPIVAPNPEGTPTPCVFTSPFILPPGVHGVAIAYNTGISLVYTDGPLGPFSNAELSLQDGGSGAIWGGIVNTPRVFNGSIYYTPGTGYATQSTYGIGCPARSSVAVYEVFPSPTFDLGNMGLLFVPGTNGSYTIIPGPNTWFSGFTNNLALGDDTTAAVSLPFAFPHAGGLATTISVSSNGFLWLDSNTNSACCSGDSITFLSDTMGRIAACWMDLYPPGGGGVFADLDVASGEFVITWSNVPEYSTDPPVTMQIALQPTGLFEIRYQAMTNTSHAALVGYSMGNVATDPGNSNLSGVVTGPIMTAGSATPLTLTASARPTLGTSINLVTGGIAAGSPLGVNVMGVQQFNPGIDLTSIGAPGCFQYVGPAFTNIFLVGGPTASLPVNIPNNANLVGVRLQGQSVVFSSGFNALGLVFSNGLSLRLDLL